MSMQDKEIIEEEFKTVDTIEVDNDEGFSIDHEVGQNQ